MIVSLESALARLGNTWPTEGLTANLSRVCLNVGKTLQDVEAMITRA